MQRGGPGLVTTVNSRWNVGKDIKIEQSCHLIPVQAWFNAGVLANPLQGYVCTWGGGWADEWDIGLALREPKLGRTLALIFIFIYWLCWVLVAALRIFSFGIPTLSCEIQFPDQGSNPGHLHWEHEVLAPRPPGKSQDIRFIYRIFRSSRGLSKNGDSQPKVHSIPVEIFKNICAEYCCQSHLRHTGLEFPGMGSKYVDLKKSFPWILMYMPT